MKLTLLEWKGPDTCGIRFPKEVRVVPAPDWNLLPLQAMPEADRPQPEMERSQEDNPL